MKELFTNSVVSTTSSTDLYNMLAYPENLLKWVPEVQQVAAFQNSFFITRTGFALNSSELIDVELNQNHIIYHSTGGRLEYELHFQLTDQSSTTLIEETLFITKSAITLPISLIKPIVKHAFQKNLENLTHFVVI